MEIARWVATITAGAGRVQAAVHRAERPALLTVVAGVVLALVAVLFALPGTAQAGAGYIAHLDRGYDLDSPPLNATHNRLDVYEPTGVKGKRPVVVYAHGGSWRTGDKANQILDKVRLFTGEGYVFVSVNYRLSPSPPASSNPARVKFPDHPHDVGEAIGWISENIDRYGGDPDRIVLLGHSAGAHLVSLVATDRRYVKAYGVKPKRLLGVVALDTAAFDVAARADALTSPLGPSGLENYWNAFGSLAEDQAAGLWAAASPLTHADSSDPPFLFVTQRARVLRQAINRAMVEALGHDPDSRVLLVDADHEGINAALGADGDPTGESAAVVEFVDDVSKRPKARITRHPRRREPADGNRTKVRFAFKANTTAVESAFECRIERRRWRRCSSPKKYRVKSGKHRFRLRAEHAAGAGPRDTYRFRILRSAASG
jgi:acetyl esterase/lipase